MSLILICPDDENEGLRYQRQCFKRECFKKKNLDSELSPPALITSRKASGGKQLTPGGLFFWNRGHPISIAKRKFQLLQEDNESKGVGEGNRYKFVMTAQGNDFQTPGAPTTENPKPRIPRTVLTGTVYQNTKTNKAKGFNTPQQKN